jgi:hypothetical protein
VDTRVLLLASISFIAADASGAREVPSAFLISKSENKNQVHYAVHVDRECMPLGSAPVVPYWRMLERSTSATEPLQGREQRIYGIERQEVAGSRVRVTLKALRTRPITITTSRDASGACTASTVATINGRAARLYNIHVALSPFGVSHLLVTGWADDGSIVRERVSP